MTKIEWTQRPGTKGATVNPIRARNLETGGVGHFCQHVSPGCSMCYAERLQPRFRNPIKYRPQDRDKVEIFLDEKVLTKPLRWRAPRTIFWCSMTDYAAPWVPDDWLDKIFAVCALTPQHTHQLLTKYPERINKYFRGCDAVEGSRSGYLKTSWRRRTEVAQALADLAVAADRTDLLGHIRRMPLPNLWIGTSCEDQRRFDERWPHLRDTPAAVRFISYEPALEAIDMGNPVGLHWVIYGAESSGPGHDPREGDWAWARDMRAQCDIDDIAFFVKQGNKGPGWKDPIPEDLQIHQWPE